MSGYNMADLMEAKKRAIEAGCPEDEVVNRIELLRRLDAEGKINIHQYIQTTPDPHRLDAMEDELLWKSPQEWVAEAEAQA